MADVTKLVRTISDLRDQVSDLETRLNTISKQVFKDIKTLSEELDRTRKASRK